MDETQQTTSGLDVVHVLYFNPDDFRGFDGRTGRFGFTYPDGTSGFGDIRTDSPRIAMAELLRVPNLVMALKQQHFKWWCCAGDCMDAISFTGDRLQKAALSMVRHLVDDHLLTPEEVLVMWPELAPAVTAFCVAEEIELTCDD